MRRGRSFVHRGEPVSSSSASPCAPISTQAFLVLNIHYVPMPAATVAPQFGSLMPSSCSVISTLTEHFTVPVVVSLVLPFGLFRLAAILPATPIYLRCRSASAGFDPASHHDSHYAAALPGLDLADRPNRPAVRTDVVALGFANRRLDPRCAVVSSPGRDSGPRRRLDSNLPGRHRDFRPRGRPRLPPPPRSPPRFPPPRSPPWFPPPPSPLCPFWADKPYRRSTRSASIRNEAAHICLKYFDRIFPPDLCNRPK